MYNGQYSLFPGIIGHNIGLLHSHDEYSYGDGTCLMGATQTKVNGPHLCFNSAKSWQLEWYGDAHLVLHAEEVSDTMHDLVSVAQQY